MLNRGTCAPLKLVIGKQEHFVPYFYWMRMMRWYFLVLLLMDARDGTYVSKLLLLYYMDALFYFILFFLKIAIVRVV